MTAQSFLAFQCIFCPVFVLIINSLLSVWDSSRVCGHVTYCLKMILSLFLYPAPISGAWDPCCQSDLGENSQHSPMLLLHIGVASHEARTPRLVWTRSMKLCILVGHLSHRPLYLIATQADVGTCREFSVPVGTDCAYNRAWAIKAGATGERASWHSPTRSSPRKPESLSCNPVLSPSPDTWKVRVLRVVDTRVSIF